LASNNNRSPVSIVAIVIGVMLVIFGLTQLLGSVLVTFFKATWSVISFVFGLLWPIALIIIGTAVVIVALRRSKANGTQRKLMRSTRNKKIAGVCGGIAEYLSVEPSIVRVVSIVLLIICWQVVLALYILFWIIIPQDSKNYNNWV
jgi:phage shock protein PspC (stress-responsive transcriptional regulator)